MFDDGHVADTIMDFESGFDRLYLGASLVGNLGSAAEVLAAYGSTRTGTVVFDFGEGDTIKMQGIATLDEIETNDFIV